MVSVWLKPFIISQLCLLFLNHNDNRNYPNNPGDFGLITCTQVDTKRFEWLLKVTILTCDLFACNQCVCMYEKSVSFWTPDRPLHLSSSAALTFLDSESWGKQKNCQRICGKRQLNCIKTGKQYKKISKGIENANQQCSNSNEEVENEGFC